MLLNRLSSPHSIRHLIEPVSLIRCQSVASDLLGTVRLGFGVHPLTTVGFEEVDGQILQRFGYVCCIRPACSRLIWYGVGVWPSLSASSVRSAMSIACVSSW